MLRHWTASAVGSERTVVLEVNGLTAAGMGDGARPAAAGGGDLQKEEAAT